MAAAGATLGRSGLGPVSSVHTVGLEEGIGSPTDGTDQAPKPTGRFQDIQVRNLKRAQKRVEILETTGLAQLMVRSVNTVVQLRPRNAVVGLCRLIAEQCSQEELDEVGIILQNLPRGPNSALCPEYESQQLHMDSGSDKERENAQEDAEDDAQDDEEEEQNTAPAPEEKAAELVAGKETTQAEGIPRPGAEVEGLREEEEEEDEQHGGNLNLVAARSTLLKLYGGLYGEGHFYHEMCPRAGRTVLRYTSSGGMEESEQLIELDQTMSMTNSSRLGAPENDRRQFPKMRLPSAMLDDQEEEDEGA